MTEETFNVLCLDGGGVRGVISTVWLQRLEQENPGFLKSISLFAGTSMGAANAAALATGMSIDQVIDIYRNDGPKLFPEKYSPSGLTGTLFRLLRRLPGFGWLDKADNLINPKWVNSGLASELNRYFGNTPLQEVQPGLLVLAAQLWAAVPGMGDKGMLQPVTMHNLSKPQPEDLTVTEAVFRSMSAPVFFPSHNGYVDGGLFATNPTIAAIGAALDSRAAPFNNLRVLSLSTGIAPDGIRNVGPLNWGLLQWARHFPDVSTSAVEEFDAKQAMAILGPSRFNRLTAYLDQSYPMDDYSKVGALMAFAERQFDQEAFREASRFVRNDMLSGGN